MPAHGLQMRVRNLPSGRAGSPVIARRRVVMVSPTMSELINTGMPPAGM